VLSALGADACYDSQCVEFIGLDFEGLQRDRQRVFASLISPIRVRQRHQSREVSLIGRERLAAEGLNILNVVAPDGAAQRQHLSQFHDGDVLLRASSFLRQSLQLQRVVPADRSRSHSNRTAPQWQLPL